MALVSLPWVNNRWMATPPPLSGVTVSSLTLDAAEDRIVYIGRFIHKDWATKTVDGVGFLFGTVVKTLLSTLKVTLQNVDLVNGPVIREDGTPDQTLSIANADAGFATNLWYEAAFNSAATRSLAPGDLVAVVFQFDSFVSGDTVAIRGLSLASTFNISLQGLTVTNLTGSYAAGLNLPNVALRCSDGTYGTIEQGFICSVVPTGVSFNVNTGTADEYALGIQFPVPTIIDGLWVMAAMAAATDTTEIILYDGTTALVTVSIDHNSLSSTSGRFLEVPITPQTLSANTLYRLAIRPTGTNSITAYIFDVANANHLQCHPGGTDAHLWTRLNQGTWGGEATTRRLFAGVRPSAFDDGAGSGGGGPIIGPGRLVRA